jgi:hypothetical protein
MRELRGVLADLEKHFTVEQQELVMELIAEIRKLAREGKWEEIEPVRKLVMEQLTNLSAEDEKNGAHETLRLLLTFLDFRVEPLKDAFGIAH